MRAGEEPVKQALPTADYCSVRPELCGGDQCLGKEREEEEGRKRRKSLLCYVPVMHPKDSIIPGRAQGPPPASKMSFKKRPGSPDQWDSPLPAGS